MQATRLGAGLSIVVFASLASCSRERGDGQAPSPSSSLTEPTDLQLAPVRALPAGAPPPVRFRVGDAAALKRFSLAVPAPSDSGECWHEPAASGNGERLVLVSYPSRASVVSVAIVTVATDGRIVQFVDRRGGVRIPSTPNVELTRQQQDSSVAAFLRRVRRSSLRLDYRTGRAFLSNEGGERPSEGLVVPLRDVAADPRFDAPAARARSIVDRCR